MSILYLKQCTRYSVKSLLRVSIVCQIILALSNAIKKLNQRTLRTLSTTLVLSVLLSACGGGGGGGGTTADGGSGGDTPVGGGGGSTPAPNSTITLSVVSSLLLVNEDFVGTRVVANATSATQITVIQSNTGIVSVTTSTTAVSVSSIENAHGATNLTIIASNGALSTTAQIRVTVSPINDPPTLSVSTNNISATFNFSTITINTTASDVEEGALTFTVQASPPGVVSITTSTNAIVLNAIPGATGQTNLTVRTVDNSNTTGMQTIVVNVLPPPNVPPVLIVSTNRISVQEDFNASVIIRTTATDANGDAITLSVSSSSRLVDAAISALSNGISTITLTAIENANGTATLNVQASANGQSVSTDIIVTVAPINDPPTLSVSTNNISANFDFSTITIHTTASDVEDGALTFSVQASSSGVVSVTTSANAIILNAMTGVSGQTTLTVRTTDTDGLSTLQTIVVNVLPPTNVPPVLIVSTNRISVQEDFRASVIIRTTATDADGDTITLSVSSSSRLVDAAISPLSNGISTITLTAIENANGTATLNVQASANGQSVSTDIIVMVAPVNDTPTLSVSTNNITTLGGFSPITINTTASDVDEGTLTFTVQTSNSGVLSVTTSANAIMLNAMTGASGRTTLTVRAVDNSGAMVTQTIAVNVIIRPSVATPVVTVSTNLISVQEDFRGSVVFQATATDADGDTITLSVSPLTSLVNAAISAPFSAKSTLTNSITLTAIANANGTATLTVQVGDAGGQSESTEIVVVVAAVEDTPTLTITTAILTVAEDFAGATTLATAFDNDEGDSLSFSVVESTTGVVSVTTSASGVQVERIAHANGVTTLTITVSDGTLSATAQVVVTVTPVNDPPSLSVSTTAVTLNEDFASIAPITLTIGDLENDPLTLTVTESNTGVVTVRTTVTTTAPTIQLSNIAHANGVTTLTIAIFDGSVSSTAQVGVTVLAVNDTPTLSVSTNSISANVNFSTITINTTASDVEDNNLSFAVTASPAGIVRATTSANAIVLNAITGASGQTTLTVRVVDSSGATVTQIISVNVIIRPSVAAPVVTVSTNLISVQEDFRGSVVFQTTATDADGDTITLSVSSSSRLVEAVISTPVNGKRILTNSITLTAVANANGTATLTVLANDAGGRSDSTEIVVVVAAVEDTPTLTITTATLTVPEDFAGATTLATAFDNDEGDSLSFSVVESTTGVVSVTTSASGVQVERIENANGATTLTITVSDGTLSATAQVVVTVTPVNDPPTLTIPTATLTVAEDFAGATTLATAFDNDAGDSLSFSVVESTTGVVSVTTSASGVQVESTTNTNGATTLTITVSDGRLSTTAQVVVTVTPVNDPPALSISTTALTLNEDFATTEVITVSRNDIDSNTLTFTVSESATGVVTVTTTDAGVQVTNIRNANGATTLTISLSDGDLTTTAQVVITVTPVNDPPTLSAFINPINSTEDFQNYLLPIIRDDVDGDSVTITVSVSTTGVLSVTAEPNSIDVGIAIRSIDHAFGNTTITVTAFDGTTSTSILIPVNIAPVNDPPSLSVSTTAVTLNEDFATTELITVTRTDIDSNTLTLTVTESNSNIVNVSTSAAGVVINSIASAFGQTILTITVNDGNISTSTQVRVTVLEINNTPTLNVSTTALTLIEDFSTTFLITVMSNDIDGDPLTISVTESTTGVVNVIPSASDVRITAIAHANGQTTLTISVNDGFVITSVPVLVTVSPQNDPPTIMSISTTALTFSEDFKTTALITVTSDDIDGDTLTISVSESNSGVVRITTLTSAVQFTSIGNANGRTVLTVSVLDDGGLSASTEVVVVVSEINDPPTITVSTNNISTIGGFTPITIDTTASDVEDDVITFAVQQSPSGVVRVTTSANAIVLNNIPNVSGQTTLTIRTSDSSGSMAVQTIAVNVAINPSSTPVLTVASNFISLQEDFVTFVNIGTTVTDSDVSDFITLSVRSSTRLVNTIISRPGRLANIPNQVNLNAIIISAINELNGTTTLTVQATDSGGLSHTTEIVVVVHPVYDPIRFTLPSPIVTLSPIGNQINRNIQSIIINNPGNEIQRAQLQVTHSGDPIFSANPVPMVSFTTNALTTVSTITAINSTAQLYFTIAPNRTGTATLTVNLSNPNTLNNVQQTLVVQVNSVDVPPVMTQSNISLQNLRVYGSRLYANSVTGLAGSVTPFLAEARTLGGHLLNINTIEELNFVHSATNGFFVDQSWYGLVSSRRIFPGELSWVTNDSTIAYGYAADNGRDRLTVYPGHYVLAWNPNGLTANRASGAIVSNWMVYNQGTLDFFIIEDRGDRAVRRAIYEFPHGLPAVSLSSMTILANAPATIRLTGYDLNGDAINTANWSGVDPNGGSVRINNVSQNSGVQTVDMVYTALATYNGQTTVDITLQTNGLSTTTAIIFNVDSLPTIVLSTHTIVLDEDFGSFVIGTTVTDQGLSDNLPYALQASSTDIVTISTSANNIQLTAVPQAFGTVTLTIQTTDSASQVVSTQVVISVRSVNDTPTLSISTDNISIIGGFAPFNITIATSDIEDQSLPFSVQVSNPGVVSISTSVNAILLSPISGGLGRTTLSVTVVDSDNTTVVRTIAVNIIVIPGSIPILTVSTNLLRLQEDFMPSVFIRTTVTDAQGDTITLSVSASTPLVSSLVSSTQGISLSAMLNHNGTATLTVRATDPGGLFASTEIVVIVTPVNDPPTLTVSTQSIIISQNPFILNVLASDVEDGILPYSVSDGLGIVNTSITSRNLTITRLSLDGSQIVLTIRAIDKNNSIVSTTVDIVIMPQLVITTGIKTLDFSWGAISTTSRYQLQSNPDGVAGFSDLSTTDIVISPNSTNIQQTTAQGLVSLHRYIPSVNNPQYAVRTCTATACESSFRHNTVALTHAQLNSMIGDFQGNNTTETDGFGFSVGLSGDGNTLAVGAPSEDSPGTGINGAQGDELNNFISSGAVYLFRRNGGVWSQQAYIKSLYPGVFHALGAAVDLSADGNTLAVGVPRDNSGPNSIDGSSKGALNSGAIIVFRFSGGVWSQQAFLKASNADDFDVFGGFISLSDDGNTLVTGVPNESSLSTGVNNFASNGVAQEVGAAYVFRYSTTTNSWSQQAYIKASNAEGGPPGTLGIGDQFGRSISLSGDGNTLAVGVPGEGSASTGINGAQDNNNAIDSGAVYLFRFSNGNWSQQAYIKSLNSERGDQFGISTSLNYDGNLLAVGASREDSVSTGINGAQDDNTLPETGAVYLFRFSSGSWTQQTYIKASSSNPDDRFGYSINLSSDGNTLAVGALLEDGSSPGVNGTINNGVQNSGAVFLLEFVNGAWVHKAYIKAPNPTTNEGFSSSLSLSDDGGALAVGISGFNGKGAYLY